MKHECGVALIRLRKPLAYYQEKYGTSRYALDKLYLLMEKQRNRGQEGAGLACVKLNVEAGNEFMFRERKEGKSAIGDLFAAVNKESCQLDRPYIGECYMGHLRYSTTGRAGISYVHPMLRRQNFRHNTLALCGNFNLTNVDEVFELLTAQGQHPRRTSDTTVLLEQIGYAFDMEPKREDRLERVIAQCASTWDGGYVLCGLLGNGEMFATRDPWGIRSAFCYEDDEIVVVASERPVIQTVMNVSIDSITEMKPGESLIIGEAGELRRVQSLEPMPEQTSCVFERIYFSRGSDRDIYTERKALGAALASRVSDSVGADWQHSVFSFIPNTAEIAFMGLSDELTRRIIAEKYDRIRQGVDDATLRQILSLSLRVEKVTIKDIKFRTFISESGTRNELANHVYDITYGTVEAEKDNLVVIDDSIVRGTTLRESIISILGRLKPKKLVIVSSAPQIRYPDFYGIDMSSIGDLIAFRAAVELRGMEVVKDLYERCKLQEDAPADQVTNIVAELYAPLSDQQISDQICDLVRPADSSFPIEIIFQDLETLRATIPAHRGDWYFSGNYPSVGGLRQLNKSFIAYYEALKNK